MTSSTARVEKRPSGAPAGGSPSASGAGLQWIKNPWVDLLIGCGAWTLPLMGLVFFASQQNFIAVSIAFYALGIFCNNPHYMATIYRAYGTRADFEKYRFFTVYVTVFMVITAVLVHLTPQLLPWLFTLYITWSPWHYTGQNYGIAMLFVRRNGGQPDPLTRNLFYGSFVASYVVWFLSMHSSAHDHPFTVSLGIPVAVADWMTLVCITAFIICGGWSLWRMFGEMGGRRLGAAAMLLATQFLWFVAAAILRLVKMEGIPPVYYAVGILAFMHCAQYLWITGYYTRRETEAGTRGRNRQWRPLRYYGILVLGGIVLFLPGPWLVSTVLQQDFTVSYLIFVSLINLHHFILDGAIWKLRDGRIARMLLGGGQSSEKSTGSRAQAHDHDHLETAGWLGAAGAWLFGNTLWGRTFRVVFVVGVLALGFADQLQNYWTQGLPTMERLSRAMFLNPADTRIYLQRAKLFEEQGEVAKAVGQLEEAGRLSPNRPEIHLELARMLTREQRYDEAEEIWQRFERSVGKSYPTLLLRATTLDRMGETERAEEEYRRAMKADPKGLQAGLQLADLLQRTGEMGKSAEVAEQVLDLMNEKSAWAELSEEEVRHQREVAGRLALELGDFRRENDDPSGAAEAYAMSAEHALAAENFAAESAAAGRAAQVYGEQMEIPGMLAWTARAVKAGGKTTDPYLSGVAWFNLARALNQHAGNSGQYLDAAAAAAAAAHHLGERTPNGKLALEMRDENLARAGQSAKTVDLSARAQELVGL